MAKKQTEKHEGNLYDKIAFPHALY